MKSSTENSIRSARARKCPLTWSVKACGSIPASRAAFSTFCPCSSVPVRKKTSCPCSRAHRASTSAASEVYAWPICGLSFT
jgi:hypothetical protein